MKIKEFSIRRYGPLSDTGRVTLGNFSLLFGKNEYGKTLTIDALVKLLLQRERKLFKQIERVDEEPEGYVVIDDFAGKETKLPEKGDLTHLTGLTTEECRNIFVIRNSDLSIAKETECYRNVTDRLTSLKTEEILSIRNQLQEIGKLTRPDSSGSLRDLAGEKLKTRTKEADDLITTIDKLKGKVTEEELDKLEETLLKVREKASETNRKIEALEEARRRKEYEEGSRAYKAIISAQENLKELDLYTNEAENLWSNCQRDIDGWTKETEKRQQEVDKKKAELEQKARELEEKRLIFDSLNNRKEALDNQIRPELRSYEIKSGELNPKEVKQRFYTVAAIISAVLLTISAVVVLTNPLALFYILLVLSVISTATFGIFCFSFIKEKAWLAGMFERIRLTASRFELQAKTPEEIISNIQKFEEEYSKRQKELGQAETSISLLDGDIERIMNIEIEGMEKKIADARNKIDGIVQKTGLRTLQEYREKLKLKTTEQDSTKTQIGILKSHFGYTEGNLKENLNHWLDRIEALKEFESKALDITYDEKSVSKLRAALAELQDKEQKVVNKISGFHNELQEIQRKANEIFLLEDDYLYCDSSVDMIAIRDKLSKFISEVEENKENARIAIGIFENIEKEEEAKISSLFGKDSPVSQYFREITGGVYQEVEFTVDDSKKVQVRLKDDSMLDATNLSGGAYDQLYLSIRLAFGQKLLKGSTGFFIMDDPFIKADKERLQRQINILRGISELGWQVIYFTAKDEVVNALKHDIKDGNVCYIELQGIFA